MNNNELKRDLVNIEIPTELHERSKIGVKRAKFEMGGRFRKNVRARLIAGIIAASLVIPTGAFAYQSLLVDDIYVSFENFKKHFSTATMEGYMLINAKLTQAKGDLGQKDFQQFKELLSIITAAKLEYGDQYGNIDYSQLPAKEYEELKAILYEIQPYFDRLNGQILSSEVLSPAEYDRYIEAQMIYEQILAQSGVNYNEADKIPHHLKDRFLEVESYIRYVHDKQAGE